MDTDTDAADTNPYAPPQVASDSVMLPTSPSGDRVLRRWIVVQCLVIAGALFFQWIDIESILFSGAFFVLVGVVIAALGRRQSNTAAIVFGASSFAYATFLVAIINIFDWGPSDATRPVQIMSWIYTIMMLPLIRHSVVSRAPPPDPDDLQ